MKTRDDLKYQNPLEQLNLSNSDLLMGIHLTAYFHVSGVLMRCIKVGALNFNDHAYDAYGFLITPRRSFDADEEDYSPDIERDYLKAVLGHFGYDEAHFEGFLNAREKAEAKVIGGFEKVYSAMPPTLWRRLSTTLYHALRL